MTDKFKKFLIEHNCLKQYNNNIKKINEHTYFDKFMWNDTPEGYEYWNELDDLWWCTFSEIESSESNEKSKIYVYQYCFLSNNNIYNSGFLECSKITSAKDAIDFKEKLCREIKLNPEEAVVINVNIVGERDE